MTRLNRINIALTAIKVISGIASALLLLGAVGSLEIAAISFGTFFLMTAGSIACAAIAYVAHTVKEYINN